MKLSFGKTAAFFLSLLLLTFKGIHGQEVNISQQLKQIEWGEISKAKEALLEFKKEHPKDASVIYLDAALASDAKDALEKYKIVADRYPKSYYADAALYRIYSYYFALGLYTNAKNYLEKLKGTYPDSPYIRLTENNAAEQTFIEDANLIKPGPVAKTENPKEIKASEKKPLKFTIQAGAFLNMSNAQKLKKSIETEGYGTEIKQKDVAGSTLNVVYVGKFASEEEARSALLLINERYKLDGRVVSID